MKCRRGWSGWAMSPQHWFKASAAFSHSLLQSDITRIPPFNSNSKRGQEPYFYPIHSIQQKEVSCAKSPHPCSRLPTHVFFFFPSPSRFWTVVISIKLSFFSFFCLFVLSTHGTEQYPPHALPPPCSSFPRRSVWPWLSLSQSPGVWRIFSTSSSKAHCTPSLVFALASEYKRRWLAWNENKKIYKSLE